MMKKTIIILALLLCTTLFLSGCFTTIPRPEQEGKMCADDICFVEAFFNCEKAFGETTQEGNQAYIQIQGKEGEKCIVYIEMLKAEGVPEFLKGLNAICKVTEADIPKITDQQIDQLDCTGPLYDALKAVKSTQ